MNTSPFHAGEQQVQARLGVREAIEPWARQVIRGYLPEQHRDFYAQLPFVVAAARDAAGQPWATLLVGPPGFVRSPDDRGLILAAHPLPGDALQSSLTAGAELGLLGIELDTRRRNRVNGTITETSAAGLRFEVGQAFGNCPQYITERRWRHVDVAASEARASRHRRLDSGMRAWIDSADTMFLASGYGSEGRDHVAFGMDASHRGGRPGFVQTLSDRRLVFPDYAGNNHFNTIGNLVMDPRIGLLFVDFQRGSLLQISGTATIDWDSAELDDHPGARRLIHVDIAAIVRLDAVLPLRWSDPAGAIRSLRLVRKVQESSDVASFEFEARDGGPLPVFEPGQHLPIELRLDGADAPVERTYSLSGAAGADRYRITVKRHPQGLASRLLHDALREGDVIGARPPAGDFVLACTGRPTVLISAGVGVTPMISMLQRPCPGQRVIFVHGARDGAHHPLAEEVRRLAAAHPDVTLDVSYSRPGADDVPGRDYQRAGRVTGRVVNELLPGLDGDFYLCGPVGFMADVARDLVALGVSPQRIHTETFGSAASTHSSGDHP